MKKNNDKEHLIKIIACWKIISGIQTLFVWPGIKRTLNYIIWNKNYLRTGSSRPP